MMKSHNIQGVALTDDKGYLVDTLSVRDLRNIVPGTRTFGAIFKSAKVGCVGLLDSGGKPREADTDLSSLIAQKEFKDIVRKERNETPLKPVTVNEKGNLGEVLGLMVRHSVHRVFVVEESTGDSAEDDKLKCVDVVTMTDLLAFIVKQIQK